MKSNNETKRCVAYFTSWGINEVDLNRLSENVTHINLSFAKIDDNFNTVTSDDIVGYDEEREPSDLYWITPSYVKWTQLKFKRPDIKMLLAYGGQTYEGMWANLNYEENVEKYAQAFVKAANAKRPVYEKPGSQPYQKVGYVTLDGIDLDFEMTSNPTVAQLNNLAKVMTRFKELAPDKLLTLTGYHVSADPIVCRHMSHSNCSYPAGSIHAGELILLLEQLNDKNLDFYNLMAYDAGRHYDWKTAMDNHANYIAKEKLVLGISIALQWAPGGNFIEDFKDSLAKVTQQKNLGYGGIMVWAIGGTSQNPDKNSQVDQINQMASKLH